jgi:uncharacterized protein YdiU (UPF0061 family)
VKYLHYEYFLFCCDSFQLKPCVFKNTYYKLGPGFFQSIKPTPVQSPELIIYNQGLADELGLSETALSSAAGAAVFAGNQLPVGSESLAMAYSGHQFGHFNQNLGDGRAILLGQIEAQGGRSFDIHMKGTGPTAFSRNGDGRAALGPVLREYLVSEAMASLGVPTTRALAAVTTGEEVIREQLLPGGIITRVASSFVRIGSFEYFLARGDTASIRRLADYVIRHHYPDLKQAGNPYLALLKAVIAGQAALIAKWMHLGFIHGVMNTDNMSVVCETIDYGPCAFIDHYAHEQVFSSIDHHGRYAYNNQPNIGLWNLTRFAECLLPLIDEHTETAADIAKQHLEGFVSSYQQHWLSGMRAKLGLDVAHDEDKLLIDELLDIMDCKHVDFTLTFYHLSRLDLDTANDDAILAVFDHAESFKHWLVKWRQRLQQESSGDEARKTSMCLVNPVYIPRNHLIEAAIRAAEDQGDFSVFYALHDVLQRPYEVQPGKEIYTQPPQPHEVVDKTFCGT